MEQASLLGPVSPPAADAPVRAVGEPWHFEVVGKPVAQGSMKAILHKHTQFPMVKPDNEKALKAWRQQVGLTAQALRPAWVREGGEKGVDAPVAVSLVFVRARGNDYLADGHTLKKGAHRFPDTAPDVDKLCRSMLDAMTGIVFVNDSRVVSLTATKRYAERGEDEKVEVEIVPL